MSLSIIHHAEDVAMGRAVRAIPMNAKEWEFFKFWLNVYSNRQCFH